DSADGDKLTESVSGAAVGTFATRPRLVDGVRGKGVRLHAEPAQPRDRVTGLALDAAKLQVESGKPFTLSFWARRPEPFAGNTRPPEKLFLLAAQTDPASVSRRSIAISHVAATAAVVVSEVPIRVARPVPPSIGQTQKDVAASGWNHYVFSRDDKNRLWLWVNGQTTATDRRPAPVWPLAYHDFGLCVAGHDEHGLGIIPPGPATMDLDDFCLFDRALSAEEIVRLAGSPNAAVAARPDGANADPRPEPYITAIAPAPKYAGDPVPPATDFKGLIYYMNFDEVKDRKVKESLSSGDVATSQNIEPTDGVRGKAVRMVTGNPAGTEAGLSLWKPKLEIVAGEPFTFAMWVRPGNAPTHPCDLLFVRNTERPSGVVTALSLRRELNEFTVLLGRGRTPVESTVKVAARQPVPFKDWTHLALTRAANGDVRWAINGQQCALTPPPFTQGFKFDTLTFGWTAGPASLLDMDEFCVFDRVLTDDEIAKLAGSPKVTPETALVAPPKPPAPAAAKPPAPPPPVPATAAKYAGGPVPAAADFPGLKYYLTCDEIDGTAVKEAVSGKSVGKLNPGAGLTDGVRGKALRLTHDTKAGGAAKAGLVLDGAALKVAAEKPFTISYWARKRPSEPAPRVATILTTSGGPKNPVLFTSLTNARSTFSIRPADPRAGQFPIGEGKPIQESAAWNHFAVVRDEKNLIGWYTNGVKSSMPDRDFPGAIGFDELHVVRTALSNSKVQADIDEVAVFDRALTDD
ncbi:MAG TPA: LamG-like jellyroll fold domain-containing protein, partial [Gemmataceae bacterium]|nr:LamG-like jellyroll fold domain-containing protein [Gemmataceae bacterium]